MIKHIPNAITAANLFFGCLAIVAIFDGDYTRAATFVGIAALLDFFDGFAARLLKVSGELGKQLDSLADVVSFGVAPGLLIYSLHHDYLVFGSSFPQFVPLLVVISYSPFLVPVFSAIRLAKFNLDTRQTNSFIGLPTPANAIFIMSIAFVLQYGPNWASDLFTSGLFLTLLPFVSAYLLVAELPLFALKFKTFAFTDNKVRYSFLATSLLLIMAFKFLGISLCILLYVVLSLVIYLTNKKHEI